MTTNADRVNEARKPLGLKTIKQVWCPICRKANTHWLWDCPNRRCDICNLDHLVTQCPYFNACQWCGSTSHASYECNSANGKLLKAACLKKCYRCKRKGHIAVQCTAFNRWVKKYGRFRYRRKRRPRRRRRRY